MNDSWKRPGEWVVGGEWDLGKEIRELINVYFLFYFLSLFPVFHSHLDVVFQDLPAHLWEQALTLLPAEEKLTACLFFSSWYLTDRRKMRPACECQRLVSKRPSQPLEAFTGHGHYLAVTYEHNLAVESFSTGGYLPVTGTWFHQADTNIMSTAIFLSKSFLSLPRSCWL